MKTFILVGSCGVYLPRLLSEKDTGDWEFVVTQETQVVSEKLQVKFTGETSDTVIEMKDVAWSSALGHLLTRDEE